MRILIPIQRIFLFLIHHIALRYKDVLDSNPILVSTLINLCITLLLISKSPFQLYLSYYLIQYHLFLLV